MLNTFFSFHLSSLLFNLIDVLCVILPILLAVAFMTIIERKQLAAHQRRVGPVQWSGKSLIWEKLSNSGDALKLIIPNYFRKKISGWSNYSCMVTTYKMSENEMGYRGSKSILNTDIVKEQRVDGSYLGSLYYPKLRCTLMGGESRYQIKIPSKQINKIIYRSYSSNSPSTNTALPHITPLDPYFVTGFSDAEASFIILLLKEPKNTSNWTVKTRFSIGLHKKDTEILELIKFYFGGVGYISAQNEKSVQYRVGSLKDLNEKIIPHFDKYPLLTQKKADFILFKKIISLINNKEHLTLEGLQKILCIKSSLNLGLSDELKNIYPNIKPIERPLIKNQKIIDPNWLAGFSSGEGCFHVRFKKSTSSKLGVQVSLLFKISQHERDKELMKSFIDYLNCGSISKNSTWIDFTVLRYGDLVIKIIPFFDKYKIVGVKLQDYLDFKKVAELMRTKDHLTKLGLDQIKAIKEGMNKER
jgi:hypothetical protein